MARKVIMAKAANTVFFRATAAAASVLESVSDAEVTITTPKQSSARTHKISTSRWRKR
jgi:hypothetical protein